MLVGEQGIELRRARRAPVSVPWAAIGLLREETGGDPRRKVLRVHLHDGRILDLPAPAESAEILKAWRRSYATRGPNPHDSVPLDFRRATAQQVDLADLADAVPGETPEDDVTAYQAAALMRMRRWTQRLKRPRG